MLTLDKLNQREAEIKGYLQQTIARAKQMEGALELLAILKQDCEAAEAERKAAEMPLTSWDGPDGVIARAQERAAANERLKAADCDAKGHPQLPAMDLAAE